MNTVKTGQWIEVDPSKAVASVLRDGEGSASGVQVSPSPYDIPLAVRVVEGDPVDPAYEVEIRYLGGQEGTSAPPPDASIGLVVGVRSGRLYRIVVNGQVAAAGARQNLDSVIKAIERFREAREAQGARTVNCSLVDFAVRSRESELVAQLAQTGQVDGMQHDHPGRKTRIFDSSWPGYIP